MARFILSSYVQQEFSWNSFVYEAQKSELKALSSVLGYSCSFVFFLTSTGRAIKAEWKR
jgi:hypothetical protein